jgi:nitrogen regulatory protein P-II 1
MKEIKAYLRPQMLDAVVDALETQPHTPGVTVTDVKGFGHVAGGGPVRFTERSKLEIVVPDSELERILETIVAEARTGSPGDGKIFVSEVTGAVRIRTGERGEAAVHLAEDKGESSEGSGADP